MIRCPHCGKEMPVTESKSPLTKETFEFALSMSLTVYTDITKELMFKVLTIRGDETVSDAVKFISRISLHTDDEVKYGLQKFFENEYHLNGYRWQWAAGMIRRENEYKKAQQKKRLPPIPKYYDTTGGKNPKVNKITTSK